MMPAKRFQRGSNFPAILFLSLVVANAWAAPRYQVLHAFTGGKDGGGLFGPLLLDASDDLYGTTIAGGPKGKGGTVFELTPRRNGTWTQKALHNFCSQPGCEDGGGPTGGVIFDSGGNLYGSTTGGGGSYTDGTVFEMKPRSAGWKFAVIHRFGRNDKANGPFGGVVMDGSGNLYGIGGCAFELSPQVGGKWKEQILHCFPAFNGDGYGILERPILDATGNLYGTTQHGGGSKNCDGGCGTVFELSPTSGGKWKEHILHRFGSSGDGAFPGVGALVLDSAGNVYGTTQIGGPAGYGTVFKLARTANGGWEETILHSFADDSNGGYVAAGVVFDPAGNLYGTTGGGGDPNCGCGVVYELSPGSDGKWTYTLLHTFVGSDGAGPGANLILDGKGNLYGTTVTGGAGGYGVAFELTP
jgi:uncharacterized repeat protein (TIGR03803 family)